MSLGDTEAETSSLQSIYLNRFKKKYQRNWKWNEVSNSSRSMSMRLDNKKRAFWKIVDRKWNVLWFPSLGNRSHFQRCYHSKLTIFSSNENSKFNISERIVLYFDHFVCFSLKWSVLCLDDLIVVKNSITAFKFCSSKFSVS